MSVSSPPVTAGGLSRQSTSTMTVKSIAPYSRVQQQNNELESTQSGSSALLARFQINVSYAGLRPRVVWRRVPGAGTSSNVF